MELDRGTLHGIATILAMVAFLAICWWAFSPRNRQRFEKDAQSIIDSDPIHGKHADKASGESK